jgi:hypothetical protein
MFRIRRISYCKQVYLLLLLLVPFFTTAQIVVQSGTHAKTLKGKRLTLIQYNDTVYSMPYFYNMSKELDKTAFDKLVLFNGDSISVTTTNDSVYVTTQNFLFSHESNYKEWALAEQYKYRNKFFKHSIRIKEPLATVVDTTFKFYKPDVKALVVRTTGMSHTQMVVFDCIRLGGALCFSWVVANIITTGYKGFVRSGIPLIASTAVTVSCFTFGLEKWYKCRKGKYTIL